MPDNQQNHIVKKYGQSLEIRAFSEYAKRGLDEYERNAFDQIIKKDDTVLDLGCGAGREAKAIAGQCSKVYALDLVPGMLRTARGFAGETNVYFMRADATSLPVRSSSVDVILMAKQFMNHITGSQQRTVTMSEAYRVLKPGGRIYLTVHNNLFNIGIVHLLNNLYKMIHAGPAPNKPAQPGGSGTSGADLSNLLAGFFFLKPRSIAVNAYRRLMSKINKGYNGKEAGDWEISHVSDALSPYTSPYHNYTVHELSALARSAGFRIDEIKDTWELARGKTLPKFLRNGAYTIAFILKKD